MNRLPYSTQLLLIARGLGYNYVINQLEKSSGVIEIDGKKVVAYERSGYTGPVVDIFGEDGYTSIFFKPDAEINPDNVLCYQKVILLANGVTKTTSITRNSINSISVESPQSISTTLALPITKARTHLSRSFEPSKTAEERVAYSEATGVPIIYDITDLNKILNTKSKTTSPSILEEPPILVVHEEKGKKRKDKKTQKVELFYTNKESLLRKEEPPIIVLTNFATGSRKEDVYRRAKNGRYVDNSSCTRHNGKFLYSTYPFNRVMAMTKDVVKPLDKEFLTGLRNGPGALISESEMNICLSLIGPSKPEGPTGGEIADGGFGIDY